MDLHTDVKSPSQIVQSLSIRGEGMVGGMVVGMFDARKARAEGWEMTATNEGQTRIFSAVKTFAGYSPDMGLLPPAAEAKTGSTASTAGAKVSTSAPATKPFATPHLEVKDQLVGREYHLKITVPATEAPNQGATQKNQASQLGEQEKKAMQDMFHMTWTVTLPGEIMETNADKVDGNNGIWYFDAEGMQKDREMSISSRERSVSPVLYAAGAASVLVLVAGIGFLLMRRRRTA